MTAPHRGPGGERALKDGDRHMAPITHPDVIDPLVKQFLDAGAA
jgi:hypothetical protein